MRARPSARRRVIGTVVGVILLSLAVVAFAVRYAPVSNHFMLLFTVAAPYLCWGAPLALVALLLARRWVLSALASVLVAAVVAVQVPLYVADTADPASVPVRVMTFNMLFGGADAEAVVATATERADVLLLQEFTPGALHRLRAAGIDRTFPHHTVEPRPRAAGAAVYSRYPMTSSAPINGLELVIASARLNIDGVATDPTVASVHFLGPWPNPIGGWLHDMDNFPRILANLAAEAGDGSVLIGGDFNSTVDMRPFRRLLAGGYREASDQAGVGRTMTFKSNSIVPPYMGIDHVLTRNATAISSETVEIPGSDHRAVLSIVQVPRN